ncbi:ParA family protein [Rothia nasimurium]|uniref:ParA family protein n=1 Tax=Rothia nasimurium TaxID=85336 RepID=UPI003BA01905
MSPKIIAFGNQKGGVGKTSITVAVAESLAYRGMKVLVLDLDQQGSATIVLGASVTAETLTMYDVLKANTPGCIDDGIMETAWENISIVPADETLAALAEESLIAAEQRLKTAFIDSEKIEEYDYVLMDLPPSLGRLTLNGLVAAEQVFAVTAPAALSVQGLTHFENTINEIKRIRLNPELQFSGVIINLADTRKGEDRFQIDQINENWDNVLSPVVLSRAAVADMASTHLPIRKTGSSSAKEAQSLIDALTDSIIGA